MVSTGRWVLLDIDYWFEDNNFYICAKTDVPCDLVLRYSLIKPERKLEPLYKRGIYLKETLRSCFVEFDTYPQVQAGDTFVHTFWIPNWTVCQTYWFYLIGYMAGVESPSESPDFEVHYRGWFCTWETTELWTWLGDTQPAWCLDWFETWSM